LGSCDTIVTYQLECAEPPAAPCDVKTNGCVTFELLRITRDAQSRKTYHIRVVNNCSNELIYTAFQLPNGIVADVPSNSSIFTTSSGRTYEVRNPNFSPFYSVRYKTLGVGLQNGQSDEFRYTLPPQSVPTYIHVLVKLAAQNFVEAHLNVFNCPVQNEADKDDFAHDRTNGKNLKLSQFNLFPNPSSGTLVVDFSDREMDEQIQFRLLNAQGQLIHEFEILPEASRQMLNLPNDLPDGLYLLEAKTKNAELVTKRFLIQK